MSTLLVTGGAGFIGSTFVHHVMAAEPHTRVVVVDALTYAGDRANLDGADLDRLRFEHADIVDGARLRALATELDLGAHPGDAIVHFAAESHVDRSIEGPAAFVRTNVVGTLSLLEVARDRALRFHHVSTDEVFGSLGQDAPRSREGDAYDPRSPYAASKAASDHLVRSFGVTYGLAVTVHHGSNTYGPRQYPEKLIPVMVLAALEGRGLPVYGDGLQVRDWLHVDDHCAGVLAVLRRGRPGCTYNIGGGRQVRNLDLVHLLCAALDEARPQGAPHAALIRHVADRPGHDRRYDMAIDRMDQELGWVPQVPLDAGLRQTVQWYLEHEREVRARIDPGWMRRNYAQRGSTAGH